MKSENLNQLLEASDFNEAYHMFTDIRIKMNDENNSSTLQRFWISLIEMIELLLNTIYSIRSGQWELILECLGEVIPFAFAYGHHNYSRYLTIMLGDMLSIPEEFPEVHQEFMEGKFAAQLLENRKFSRSETDKVIEMTLNKETKSSGGTTGFSTNKNVKRWELNTTYRATMRACFHEHLNY